MEKNTQTGFGEGGGREGVGGGGGRGVAWRENTTAVQYGVLWLHTFIMSLSIAELDTKKNERFLCVGGGMQGREDGDAHRPVMSVCIKKSTIVFDTRFSLYTLSFSLSLSHSLPTSRRLNQGSAGSRGGGARAQTKRVMEKNDAASAGVCGCEVGVGRGGG